MSEVFVLGHRGMLGHVVVRYLQERGHEIRTSDARYAPEEASALIEAVRASEAGFVVNALGLIKQKSTEWGPLVAANALFPVQLRARLHPSQRLLHASTDCVFDGIRGGYDVATPVDARDLYGLSKIAGERIATMPGAVVVRTSTIGPEQGTAIGLMGWLQAQRGTVKGFVDHRWNGITTLEWAKVAASLIEGVRPWRDGLVQMTCAEPITKYELAVQIRDRWALPFEVERHVTGNPIDRTLRGEARSAIDVQLGELHAWLSSSP